MAGLFDLHCDTLTRERRPGQSGPGTLDDPRFQLALSKMPAGTPWVQCFAVFIPDGLRGRAAVEFFDRYQKDFRAQTERYAGRVRPCRAAGDVETALNEKKCAAILTVEGGCVLAGELERVWTIRDAGVRMLTLTWNGKNELGSGHETAEGLTPFGREAVAALEAAGIVVDVSHLNDRGFEDVAVAARKPFVASHSNARSVTDCRRNLPDEAVREIAARGGLIGLNFCRSFLSDRPDGGGIDDVLRHADRFLELGAEKALAIGSDYDGAEIHPELDSVEKALGLREALLRHGVPQDVTEDILFGNALRFFRKWMT